MPKSKTKLKRGAIIPKTSSSTPEIMTISEAAAFLRVPQADVLEMVQRNEIPARRINDQWRLSKLGLHQWLCRQDDPDDAIRHVFGMYQNDPVLEALVRELDQLRGRTG